MSDICYEKSYRVIDRFESTRREKHLSSVIPAVGKMLKPIKADLATIKGQLDGIGTAIDDLTRRIEEIEKLLKTKKVKVP